MRFKNDHFHQLKDYSIIKGLEPDDLPIHGRAFLEAIPPPTTPCIQLHRLEHGQNLAHLFLLYHHFGAKAIIFVNTADNFCLPQELLNTTNASREGTTRVNCVLVSKAAGDDLISHCSQGGISCDISPYSCENQPPSTPFSHNRKPEKGDDCIHQIYNIIKHNSLI